VLFDWRDTVSTHDQASAPSPDVGSEGNDVIDLEVENRNAVGMVFNQLQFPDRLIAPPRRTKFLEDGANPVYDKEIRCEIFAQGTLMLRVVCQVSMLLALPLMCVALFIWPQYSPWYISYVVVFNMLVGPVFSAGSMTSERERETLDLLLTTTLSPTSILWGKLLAGLRVSSVLTVFLIWPLLLAIVMTMFETWPFYLRNWMVTLAYLAVYVLTCLTTTSIALCCSVLFRRTATAMMMAYTAILVLFTLPLALSYFANNFFAQTNFAKAAEGLSVVSPFAALFHLPISMPDATNTVANSWAFFVAYLTCTSLLLGGLWLVMLVLFQYRWRLSD
jgi:ABC-type transport system involved in multi-copper enzyme maturation permease subunit